MSDPLRRGVERYVALAHVELMPRDATARQTLGRIADVAERLLPATGGVSLVVVDPRTGRLEDVITTLPGADRLTRRAQLRGPGAVTSAILEAGVEQVHDAIRSIDLAQDNLIVDAEAVAYAGIPIFDAHDVVGVLYAFSAEQRMFDDNDLRFLKTIADRAAVVIRSQRASVSYEQSLTIAESLFEVTSQVATAETPTEIVETVLHGLTSVLPIRAVAWLPTPDGLMGEPVLHSVGPNIVDMPALLSIAGDRYSDLVGRQGVFEAREEPVTSALCAALGADAVLIANVRSRSTDHGVLVAGTALGAGGLSLIDGRFAAALTDNAAVALEKLRLMRELERQASTDPLTGIANRRQFIELAARETKRAARKGSSYAVLMLDIDHFKAVNDNHGHGVGDDVLAVVASRLAAGLRETDLLARFGGEEFICLLPDTGPGRAIEVAERLRTSVGRTEVETRDAPVSVTMSIGVALGSGDDDLDGIIESADQALYNAKHTGRDRVKVAKSAGTATPLNVPSRTSELAG